MKLYIPLSIAFLILISIASGAVGGVSIKDTGNVRGQQQASLIGSDLQPVSAQSFTTGSIGNYQSNSALAQAKGSGYPVPPINSPTDEQLAAENLGLTIPQMDSFTPDERLDFISVSGPSGLVMPSGSSAARKTGSGSSVWYYPSSVASANRFYVQSNFGLQTVGGCGYRGYLPLWADIKTSGNFYVYEWYPGQSTYSVQFWGWMDAGWKKGWFSGDVPGWHILCYNSGIWSNFIYIYVYPLSASDRTINAPGGQRESSLLSGEPTPIDPGSEGLVMPDFNLYRPASTLSSGGYNYLVAASTRALAGDQAASGMVAANPSPVNPSLVNPSPVNPSVSPSMMSQTYPSGLVAAQGKAKTVSTAKTCTTCNTCTSSTSITSGVSSVCPFNEGCSSCSAMASISAPAGYVAQSPQAVYPLPSVCKCNEYYVQVCEGDLQTVAGVFSGEWLALWSKLNRAGEYWSFEWTVCGGKSSYYCSPDVKNFGKKNVGWHETWFKGNEPGWHILSYHCNDWSNYVYIYVWPAD